MNWDAIGAIGEIVGAAAVVLTLAYLATQIRLTRELEKATSIRDMLVKGREAMVYSSNHPGSLETLRKGVTDYSALSVTEKDTFHGWAIQLIVTVEQAMYMYQSRLLPQGSWAVFENFGVALISTSGGAQWWADYQNVFNHEVVEKLNIGTKDKVTNHLDIYDLFPHWRE